MLNLISGLGSIAIYWYSGWDPIWLGVFFTTFPVPFFLMVLSQALKITRTSKNLPLFQLLSLVSLAWVFYCLYTRQGASVPLEYIALGMTIFGALSLQWYIRVFSPYRRKKSASIIRNQTLPELPLEQLNGTKISSSSFAGTKTLIVFFRANWCPFCMNQLKEIVGQASRLKKAGVQVKFVSNQGAKNSRKLEKDLKLPDNFEILQDEDLQAARILGIADIGGSPVGMPGYPADTVMATVIALNAEGKVLFGDETDNYRVRPHPNTFLPVFE